MKKKVLTLLLTVTMALAVPMTAFATEDTTQGIEDTSSTSVTHAYGVYAIFTGTLSDGKLTEADWAVGVKDTAQNAIYAQLELTVAADQTKDKALEAISTLNPDSATKLAAVIAKQIKAGNIARTGPGTDAVSSDGYYAIYDETSGSTLGTETADLTSLQVIANGEKMEAFSKHSSTFSYKKVMDINDSDADAADENGSWRDDADYDIGDSVPFQLTGYVAADYDSYDTYEFIFHDEDEDGLDYEKITSVTIDEVTISDYEVVTSTADNCSFEVIIGAKNDEGVRDLKEITTGNDGTTAVEVRAGSKIQVEYTAKLTANAVIGEDGNPNKMRVEFSNNANNGQKGYTKWDGVKVFTYKVSINKVDQDKKALTGAMFALYKQIKGAVDSTNANTIIAGDGSAYDRVNYNGKVYTKVGEMTVDTTGATFGWTGLDDGNYLLVETTVPSGYNAAEPVEFTVDATHNNSGSKDATTGADFTTEMTDGNIDGGVLYSLTGNKTSGAVNIAITEVSDDKDIINQVINQKGATLPGTGGVGTTIFYVIGGILIVGAGVLLFVKTRTKK